MSYAIQPGQRCNWWRVIQDLHMHGMSFEAISEVTQIPKSTLAGFKNLDAEPKHADGEVLLGLWRARMMPPVPIVPGSVRNFRLG